MNRELSRAYELFEGLYTYEASNDCRLKPASKLVWLGLALLASLNKDWSVKASMSDLCSRLGLCDKTLKRAIDELQEKNLLVRKSEKTDLGAHSYRYYLEFPKGLNLSISCLSYKLIQDLLLKPRQLKITANQRLLLILTLVISGRFGFISAALHSGKMSKLTGIPKHNILPNLIKLKKEKHLTTVLGYPIEKKNKPSYVFVPTVFTLSSYGIYLSITDVNDVILTISLLLHKKNIERFYKDGCMHMKYGQHRLINVIDILTFLDEPFFGAPSELREYLLKAIYNSSLIWKKLERDGLLTDVSLVVHNIALQVLSECHMDRSKSLEPYSYFNRSQLSSLLREQVSLFHLTKEQQDKLLEVLMPLCALIATSLKNQLPLDDFRSDTDFSICLKSIAPMMELRIMGETELDKRSVFSNYRQEYGEKLNDDCLEG